MNETRLKRAPRTTRMQYELYLDEPEKNEAFRENRFTGEDPQIIKNSWEKLCLKLNSTGGSIKSISEWKRTFSDWKAHVRKRARNIRASRMETGNVGQPEKLLTDIEERLLALTGKVVVEGLPVIELGVGQNEDQTFQEVLQVEVAKPSTFRQVELGDGLKHQRAPTTTPRLQGIKRPRGSETVDVLKSIDNTLKQILELKTKSLN